MASCNREPVTATNLRGVYTVDGRLHVGAFGTPDGRPITDGGVDMKPSWSKLGDQIVFFRLTESAPEIPDWKTAICVVRADGTGFRQLTDGTHTDFNPTWSRDGANTIYFSRRDPQSGRYAVFATASDAAAGEETLVSDPRYGTFAFSCLADGRILVASDNHPREAALYLMTPAAQGRDAVYERLAAAFEVQGFPDRVSVSPSETRITCEVQHDDGPYRYPGRTLYIADFDATRRTVSNPQAITTERPDPEISVLYPCWTGDESGVVYHGDRSGTSQLYMYRLADGATFRVSVNPKAQYMFPCGEAAPK